MHSLIVHVDALFPPAHGGAKCIRALAEALASRGHRTTVVLRTQSHASPGDVFAQSVAAINERGISLDSISPCAFSHAGVNYIGVAPDERFADAARRVLGTASADLVIVTESSLASSGALLDSVLQSVNVPIVLFAWTIAGLPFGPASAAPDRHASELFDFVAKIFVPSEHTAQYVRRWSGRQACVTRFPVFGGGPFATLGDRNGPVLYLNPSDVKGLPIAVPLIKQLPSVRFRVVPGWGTTARDMVLLDALPNVEIVPRHDSIVDLLEGVSVVLFPSLVEETFPLVPIEAMLHGVPVLASNIGAVPDAMLGCRYLLPVKPLERVHIPRPKGPSARWLSPPQDAGPWVAALRDLRAAGALYDTVSREAATAARGYAATLRWDAACDALVEAAGSVRPPEAAHA
jgi:glycosyltransferase involved in cell wall biosynthesis